MAGPWVMDDQESETVFDHLVSVRQLHASAHSLTRVPSLKNLGALEELLLGSNQIKTIRPNDFAGATRLLQLDLSNNGVTSVAAEAFNDLTRLRFEPQDFNPKGPDNKTFVSAVGFRTFTP